MRSVFGNLSLHSGADWPRVGPRREPFGGVVLVCFAEECGNSSRERDWRFFFWPFDG